MKNIILYLIIIFMGGYGLFIVLNQFINTRLATHGKIQSPLIPTTVASPTITETPNIKLKTAVDHALEDTKGTYGIAVKNLKTNETFFSNEHHVFEAGSLYKLWTMAVVYKKIQNKELQEDEKLSRDISYLNDRFKISSDSAEQTSGTITLTVKNALTQMITISHNYAALLLTEKMRLSTVSKFLVDNGLSESKVGSAGEDPTTTAYDTALFFEKLYKGELADKIHTEKMLELLKKQTLNHKLPKNLPSNTVIAHKTGEIGLFSHDAGIVYLDKKNYIIVILSESKSPPGAEARIAEISKSVYDHFTNNEQN